MKKKFLHFLFTSGMLLTALLAVQTVRAQGAYKLTALGDKQQDATSFTADGTTLMIYQPGDGNNRHSWLTLESKAAGAKLKLADGLTDGTNPYAGADVTAYLFTVERQGGDTIALKAANGEYVSGQITSSTRDNITTSPTNKALFLVEKTGTQFFFKRVGVSSTIYLNTQATPYVNYWNGSGDWSKWDVFVPQVEEVKPDTLTISATTGTLSHTGNSSWNNLWTSAADSLKPTLTLTATANNMVAGTGDYSSYLDMRSGSPAKNCTYTIALPTGYKILSYTIHGKAIGSNAQTVTPTGGQATVFSDSILADLTVSIAGEQNTAAFTLTGENTGLYAMIDVAYEKLDMRTVAYNVVFNGAVVAADTVIAAINSAAAVPADLEIGDFATFSYDPVTITDTTTTVTATLNWSAQAPIRFSGALNDDANYYNLRIANNATTVYFNYTADSVMPNIACDPADSLYNGQWAFLGNPYAVKVMNRGAGAGVQLASPATSASTANTGGETYAVLTSNFTTYPDSTWRIVPATRTSSGTALTTGGFYLRNAQGHCLNIRRSNNNSPYHLAYWTTGYDAGSAFLPTAVAKVYKADTLTIATATGALSRTGSGTGNVWNNLWTSTADSLKPTVTLTASANNMQIHSDSAFSAYLDIRSGQSTSSTYTIALPTGYRILSYTIRGKAIGSSAQTVTPDGGQATVFNDSVVKDLKVSISAEQNTAAFTLTGANSGLYAMIDVEYQKLATHAVAYNVVYKGEIVATDTVYVASNTAAAIPEALALGNFASFAYSPATISDTTTTVTAALTWSPQAPIQFSDALDDSASYYKLRISNNATTVYFNYTGSTTAMPNIACNPADSLNNGLWAFMGNPYAVVVKNLGAGAGVQLASPATSASTANTGLATYAVLTNDFAAYPDSTWRILPATLTSKGANLNTGGFYLRNQQGHCLNIRNASGSSVYHLAYWTQGYDAGSSFLPTEAKTVVSLGATVQGFRTTGRGVETWLTRTVVNAPDTRDGGTVSSLTAQLKGNTANLVDEVRLYAVNNDTLDFYVLKHPEIYQVGGTKSGNLSGLLTFDFGDKAVSLRRGQALKLYLTARVKSDAPVFENVDASITGITIDDNNITPADGDPDGQAKIFKTWAPVFHWKNHGYAVWRIPAMTRAYGTNGEHSQRLVAVIDGTNDGFNQNGNWNPNPDPGYAPINVFYSVSDDNGRTWGKLDTLKLSSRTTGSNTYSFGDPAIVRCKSGKLIVMTCATDKTFWGGQTSPYMFTSTNNGDSFDAGHTVNTQDILTDEVAGTKGFGGFSWFVTSGHGICTTSGRVMFLVNYIKNNDGGKVGDYVLYSDDEGEHWTIGKNPAWADGGNESKLVQLPNGKILASVRRYGPRGFNLSTDENATEWTGQRTPNEANGGIHDAGVNADVIAYGDSMLIHTIINNHGSGSTRTDLEVFVSADQGQSWTKKFCVQDFHAGYSTMDILDNGDLAILFEDGSYHYGNNQYDTDIIHYYDITYLTVPADTVATWGKVSGIVDPQKRDELTGIYSNTPWARARVSSGRRYNLQGQPVGPEYKGIVIQDGKKILVK